MTLADGTQLHDFTRRLYPICRSITGDGVRETLRVVSSHVPLKISEIPSGSRVFDWEVPLEWNIEDACVSDSDGRRVVDFQAHNLHLVGYSEPVEESLSLEDLNPHLYSLEEHPDRIPYRTSYYRRNWGFCLRERERKALRPGKYRVAIKSSLARGSLTYGEALIRGQSRDEVVIFAHVCHPSLANDNTSGIAVSTALAQWVATQSLHYTYRFVFAPVTIGALCWLKQNEHGLERIRHGLVLALLGDSGALTYKMTRRHSSPIDAAASYVLSGLDPQASVIPFSPYGYDERQLGSPGFNLPVGRLTRSVNGGYSEYHTSADDLSLIKPEFLQQSLEACQRIVTVLEGDGQYVNLSPKGEPQLGKRGLYAAVGGRTSLPQRENAILWVLNQSDGTHSLLDIARRSGIDFNSVRDAARELQAAGLLRRGAVAAAAKPKSRPKTQLKKSSAAVPATRSKRKTQQPARRTRQLRRVK